MYAIIEHVRAEPDKRQENEVTPHAAQFPRLQSRFVPLTDSRPQLFEYEAASFRRNPERNWIHTRNLWLCGEEPGQNRLGEMDSMRRHIYIHTVFWMTVLLNSGAFFLLTTSTGAAALQSYIGSVVR
jgi:hypothetical protein